MEEKKGLPDPTKPRKDYRKQKVHLSDEAYLQKHLSGKEDRINKEMRAFIQAKKQQAHDALKLYIDLDLKELKKEWKKEMKAEKAKGLAWAMLDSMLIGDQFLCRKKKHLKIRYYTDNLSFDRPKLYQQEEKKASKKPVAARVEELVYASSLKKDESDLEQQSKTEPGDLKDNSSHSQTNL